MKNIFSVLILVVIAGLVVLTGCKRSQPTQKPAMDMSKTAKETTEQAAQTSAEVQKTVKTAVAAATEQTMCPILPGNPIDKSVFIEYKGKKVYFCCEMCKADFNKDPEKYIKDLPQFKQ